MYAIRLLTNIDGSLFDTPHLSQHIVAMQPFTFVQIPCLTDNYCVLVHDAASGLTAAIDAPDAATISATLDEREWRLTEIFVTHHHHDHTAGCRALVDRYGCKVTGPESEAERIPGLTRAVRGGSELSFANQIIRVIETPGHTLGHVSYYFPETATVFTGDTLFALGCGRLFEGDAEMMFTSLQKLAALPGESKVFCGHEYTLANARFAATVEPENDTLLKRCKAIEVLIAAGKPTLPTTIGEERATNPFLRTHSTAIRARLGMNSEPDWKVFARLRELKNKA